MKAVIIVGGSGTRLSPLVDFANKPIILHQIEALKAAGVTEVVLAINPQQWKAMVSFMVEFQKKLSIKIAFSLETEPLGTAGHLALARSKLIDESDKPFFVLNSNVICKYPLREIIEFHKIHGAEASIMVTGVGEPFKYGVVVMEEATGKVQSFVEKPKTFVGNKINAGIYLLNTSVLDKIRLRPTSIEKEIFPKIVSENKLYAMVFPGFWMDVDEPKDYITGQSLYLESLREKASPELRKEDHHIIGNVIMDDIPCRMKALILVGGFGTRLRPLTFSIPKPLIDFANKPMILHQIEALKAVGVTEVVLAINHQQPEVMLNFMREFEKKLDIKITFSQETEPLGTAGPLALARDKLIDESGEPFFVLNSDVICEYPLREMIAFHKTHGAEASIMVTEVGEPSKYGVVVMEEATGRVQSFVEKPKTFVGNKINAGIYLLNPSVLDRIELRPTSIEKEIFPKIVSENKLYAMVLPGFWMDIGQPIDYITGQRLYLESLRKKASPELRKGVHIIGNVIVDESAKIGEKCLIGPDVVIGPGCVIEPGVRLSHCTVMRDAHIKKNAYVSRSIVGWQSTIGRWARIDNITILGKDVHVADEVHCNQIVVNPNTEIKS